MAEQNLDLDDSEIPDDFDSSISPASFVLAQRRRAGVQAINDLEASPDDAATAAQLARATGAGPATVYGNLENFQQQHKAALTTAILDNNPYIRDYIQNHPLGSKISNDDYGQLDKLSQALQSTVPGKFVTNLAQVAKDFGEGFGSRRLGLFEPDLNHPGIGALAAVGNMATMAPDIAMRAPGGVINAVAQSIRRGYEGITGRSGEEATENFLQAISDPGLWSSMPGGALGMEMTAGIRSHAEEVRRTAPYLKAGELPPPGVSETIDKLRQEDTKGFVKDLTEQTRAANQTNTIERDPESFKAFVNQHKPEHIELQADAVRSIYGDEPIVPGDGRFGDIPGFGDELALAERHNGHVQVPLADWFLFANQNPEEAKFLQKFASRPGGITQEEGEQLSQFHATRQIEEPEEPKPVEGEDKIPAQELADRWEDLHGRELAQRRAQDISGWLKVHDRADEAPFYDEVASLLKPTAKILSFERTANTIKAIRDAAFPSRDIGLTQEPGSQYIIAPAKFEREQPVKVEETEVPSSASFPLRESIKSLPEGEKLGWLTDAPTKIFGAKFMDEIGNTPVHVVPEEGMAKLAKAIGWDFTPAGYYDTEAKHIVINERVANGEAGANEAIRTILHEGSHAFMQATIEKYPELKSMIEAIMKGAGEAVKDSDNFKYFNGLRYFDDAHEFIAGAHSDPHLWDALQEAKLPEDLHKALALREDTKTFWDAFREVFKNLWEKAFGVRLEDSYLDAVLRVTDFAEQLRKGTDFQGKPLATKQPELPGITRMESRAAFKTPGAAGLSADALRRYMGLIEKQNEADTKFIQDKALEDERKRQTAEWKENEKRVKSDVRSAIYQRPVIAADRYFREGIIDGRKAGNFKLDAALLTDEQKRSLDPEYYGRDGGAPDDMAGVFGYQSGDALVQALAGLKAERDLEGLTPQAHISKLVNVAAEHEMQRQYGDLEENILREAKEHVFSPSQIDILADETIHLASLAGSELPISKEDMMKGAKQVFDAAPLRAVDSKAFEASAARAGQAVQDALLKGDARAALKAKQEQTNAAIYANLALKFEKKLKRFQDVDAPRWGRREPPGVPQEDAVWMHQILLQVLGPEGIQTSRQDLERRKEMSSPYQNLREYVEAKNKANGTASTDPNNPTVGQRVTVLPDLFSANWPGKAFDGLSTTEFQGVYDSLKSINHYGHEINSYTVKGNKEDLARVVDGLVERLKAAVDNKPAVEAAHETSILRNIGSLLLNTETWMNRLDLGNRQGPFNQLIMRPITEGQYELRQFEKDFSEKWKGLGDFPDFNKKIANTMFRTSDGRLIEMTKGNAYAVLANMGNALQRRKLVQGWGISKDFDVGEQMVWNWLKNVAGMGPEDLARAQKMGKIFSDAFELAEKSWVQTAGVAPARIELYKVRTPWGDADEWYHPLIADPLRHQGLTAEDMINQGQGFWRPSPASGYTKTRTGAVYPIDLTFNAAAFKLKQILNDAAMRLPITEVSKIVYNKKFQEAFKEYYGPEYHSALDAWMKDAAGNRQWQPSNMKALERMVTDLGQNMSSLLIGFNPSTVMKHGLTAGVFSASEVGFKNWANSMMHIIKEAPGSRQTWNWVFENSEEIRNRLNHIEDTLANQNRNLFSIEQNRAFDKTRRRISNFRDAVSYYGHYPVGFGDLLSAVSMFHAEYGRLNREDPSMTHGDLVYAANTAVRRTHGSSILTNRAGIMRSSPWVRLVTPFYNFMNNALQRNYENTWKAKLAVQGRELPEMVGFDKEEFEKGMQHIPSIIGGVAVFGLTLGLVAWLVNKATGNAPPQRSDESKAAYWGKVLASGYADQVPAVKDIFNSVVGGHDPSIGLYGTAARDITKPLSFKEWNFRQNPGKALRTGLDALGVATGLTTAPANKLAEYVTNVLAGHEHPKGFGDLWAGALHGTQQVRR